jgi:hypothetical protein
VRAQGQGAGAAQLRGRRGRSPTRRAVRPGGRDDARVPPVGGTRRRDAERLRWWVGARPTWAARWAAKLSWATGEKAGLRELVGCLARSGRSLGRKRKLLQIFQKNTNK